LASRVGRDDTVALDLTREDSREVQRATLGLDLPAAAIDEEFDAGDETRIVRSACNLPIDVTPVDV
jgi:hypothetical protein